MLEPRLHWRVLCILDRGLTEGTVLDVLLLPRGQQGTQHSWNWRAVVRLHRDSPCRPPDPQLLDRLKLACDSVEGLVRAACAGLRGIHGSILISELPGKPMVAPEHEVFKHAPFIPPFQEILLFEHSRFSRLMTDL